jgi:hypothetical protein
MLLGLGNLECIESDGELLQAQGGTFVNFMFR